MKTAEDLFGTFQHWQEAHNHLVKKMMYGSPEFLWIEDERDEWISAVEDWVTEGDISPQKLIDFEGGVSLQSNYPELVGQDLQMQTRPNNFQLYFEVEDLDFWQNKIEGITGIEFIHKSKEYP